MLQSDGISLASSYPWLSFDSASETITVVTSTAGLGGVYNLKYKCTLDDFVGSIEETDIVYYILEAETTSPSIDLIYLLNQDVIRQNIAAYTYKPLTLPLTGTATWTYSLAYSTGNDKVCTIATDTGSDLLVGTTSSVSAGVTTGIITDKAQAGASVYVLTAVLNGIDSLGRPFTITSTSVNINIEIMYIDGQITPNDITYRASETANVQSFNAFT